MNRLHARQLQRLDAAALAAIQGAVNALDVKDFERHGTVRQCRVTAAGREWIVEFDYSPTCGVGSGKVRGTVEVVEMPRCLDPRKFDRNAATVAALHRAGLGA